MKKSVSQYKMQEKTSLTASTKDQQKIVPPSHGYGACDEIATPPQLVTNSNLRELPTNSDNSDQMRSTITFFQKIGYGLGHVYNDLCAGVWFSYTLLFMQGVMRMPGAEAGAMVTLGQVFDAICTPIVGLITDKYGTKRKWHIFGSGLVLLTFPAIFALCLFCDIAPLWWRPTYYAIAIMLFQFGWPVVQITHLSMIPELSRTQKDRSDLTAIRYSASVISNLVVYFVTWGVLHARNKNDTNIGPSDAFRFRDIALILSLIGISMTVLFHFSLSVSNYDQRRQQANRRSVRHVEQGSETDRLLSSNADTTVNHQDDLNVAVTTVTRNRRDFLKSPLLYQNSFLYVFSRLFMTTSLIYMPLWLDERSWTPVSSAAQFNPIPQTNGTDINDKTVEHIATVPLVSFLASFVASIVLKFSSRLIGHKVAYLLGSVVGVAGCVLVALGAPATASTYRLFGIAILFGAGSSVTMISSLCITADMIGPNSDKGGFIYSAVTFADKLITGIAVMVIETLKCSERNQCPEYYKIVLSYACGTAALLGVLTLFTIQCTRYFCRQVNRTTVN